MPEKEKSKVQRQRTALYKYLYMLGCSAGLAALAS
jgi:hypothetical protein